MKMYAINDKEPKNKKVKAIKRPEVIYPTKVVKLNNKLKEKLALIFSYEIVFIDVLNSNTDKVFVERTCSFCNQDLYFADCYHKKDNLRTSLFRFCHYCKTMFVLTGRFESEEQFDEAFGFFDKNIYVKKRFMEEGTVLNGTG